MRVQSPAASLPHACPYERLPRVCLVVPSLDCFVAGEASGASIPRGHPGRRMASRRDHRRAAASVRECSDLRTTRPALRLHITTTSPGLGSRGADITWSLYVARSSAAVVRWTPAAAEVRSFRRKWRRGSMYDCSAREGRRGGPQVASSHWQACQRSAFVPRKSSTSMRVPRTRVPIGGWSIPTGFAGFDPRRRGGCPLVALSAPRRSPPPSPCGSCRSRTWRYALSPWKTSCGVRRSTDRRMGAILTRWRLRQGPPCRRRH